VVCRAAFGKPYQPLQTRQEAGYAAPYFDVEYGPDRTILTLPLVAKGRGTCQNLPESLPESPGTCQNLPESKVESAKAGLGGAKVDSLSSLPKLTNGTGKVYDFLLGVKTASAKDIATELEMSPRTVRAILARLQDAQLVESVGAGKNTVYRARVNE
jgi:DNA-binding transcriptional ArsR family regulator